jgi:4'-phosphopantetheinyl transferase
MRATDNAEISSKHMHRAKGTPVNASSGTGRTGAGTGSARGDSVEDDRSPEDSASCLPSLQEREVHVWSARLDLAPAAIERLGRLLNPEESARASRFHFDRDRNAFTVARGVLRTLLGRYLRERPERIRFVYGTHGKPALAAEQPPDGVRFNLSHSDAVAIFAFARSVEVGIDVERIREQPDLDDLANRFFSKEEASALRRLPPSVREAAFFFCWTAKEAYIKGIGEGLSMPLDRFAVSLDPPEGPIRLRIMDAGAAPSVWRLHRFEPSPGYVAAVAVAAERFVLRHRVWRPEGSRC